MPILKATAIAVFCAAGLMVMPAFAERPDDGLSVKSYEALKGKKIVYMPLALSYDISQAWVAGLEREATRLGYEIIIRDPNWVTDNFVQGMQAAIREKPDLLVIQPPDTTSLSRVVRKAQEAGIRVVQINQMTTALPDIFVGTDFYSVGLENGKVVAGACGNDGRSGKVAIITGAATAPASINQVKGIMDGLADNASIEVVATQAADWDPSKSNAIASTLIKQHPDLCAIIDAWDGQATGAASAISNAGMKGKIILATEGGGEMAACAKVKDGTYNYYVSMDTANQARDLNAAVKMLLQTDFKAGSMPFALYSRNKVLSADTLRADSCWTVDDIRKNGG
ncbi:sugar ABC transporter substrate-binding protein [Sinorhizobium sp. GL28]|jgi:ABC-type sugar transport system substrate-binding protein|uniref:sugar ABC transporter substrate-binding protein n=1 Tax=Sinorhizobium sp. GL28 TaxID=1358418 RepID=UPI00071C8B19|nr:sugar ABC transporter substrate-binding protein [Sinorhizobium sp. GL28]KSV87269.1 hypothetical protein N184_31470 [Sinorhizobium sp. GL28]